MSPFPFSRWLLRIILSIILVGAKNEKEITHASKLPSLTRTLAYIIFIDIAIMNTFYLPVAFFLLLHLWISVGSKAQVRN